MIFKKALISLLVFMVFSSTGLYADSLPISVQEGWGWPVLFLAPDSGWESDEGSSIAPVLEYVQKGINDSVDGLREHDVVFDRAIVDERPVSKQWREWKNKGYLAVVSFAGEGTNGRLARSWVEGYPPLIMVDDDTTSLRGDSEVVLPGLFSLQFHRSFTTRAMVERASEILPTASEVAVISDLLAEYLSRSARSVAIGLREKGLTCEIFWVSGAAASYNMTAQETMGFGADMIVFMMDQMGTREFFREIRHINGSVPLGYGRTPDPTVSGLNGLIVADQDYVLDNDKSTKQLKTDVWDVTRIRVKNRSLAAKAYASCQWVISSFEAAPDVDVKSVTQSMAKVKDIPYGEEKLDINPVTHRPLKKKIAYMKALDGKWVLDVVEELQEVGPGYFFETPKER